MSTSKLRQAARGLALAAETCSLLISDALGALVERLEDKTEIGSMTIPVVPEIQKPITVEDLEAMRGGFSRNTFTFRAESWHSDGCDPELGCVPGCAVMREKADRLAHAGYGNAFADAEIRDDESTRSTLRQPCGAVQPWKAGQTQPYICDREKGHGGEHSASGVDNSGEWLERWADS